VSEPLDGSSAGPEPYVSEGRLWVVAQAEAELAARHGGLEATGWTRRYVDPEGMPLAAGWVRFRRALA
jgi:hypothetical protein